MKPTSKTTTVTEVKPPKEFPEIMAMPVGELSEKIRSSLDTFYREGLYSVNLAYMARAAMLLEELSAVDPEVKMIAVPLKHVAAVEATLGYLVNAG